MIDIVEVLERWYAGRPKLVVAESLGVDRKTIRKYVTPAEEAGFVPGGPPVTTEEWALYVRSWFPELVVPELRNPTFAECVRLHDVIKGAIATNHLATVYQRLRDEHGVGANWRAAGPALPPSAPRRRNRGGGRGSAPPIRPGAAPES